MKAGDAKPWVYHRNNGHDCQAAEDHKENLFVYSAWLILKPGCFIRVSCESFKFAVGVFAEAPARGGKMTPGFYKSFVTTLFVLTVTVIITAGYAYASGNTLTSKNSGDGLGTVSGYVIDNVAYNPSSDLSKIASVSFTLNAEAAWVKIQLTDTQSDWYDCMNTMANQWTCNTNNTELALVNQLRVAASGQ